MMIFSRHRQPELISIHIPKTAGTSFRNILKSVYGDREVVRFDISMRGVVRLNEKPYAEKQLPSAKVIHGHFSYEALKGRYGLPEGCPVITWLRDPVQRVASNYYYLESRLVDILQEEKHDLHILEKMQRTLPEFARAEINRNRMAKFLNGIDLRDLTFIGIQEQFETDLPLLAAKLKWPKVPEVLYHNVTSEKEVRQIPYDVAEEIRALNAEDVKLFEEAMVLRNLSY
jgi:hypothetical protein